MTFASKSFIFYFFPLFLICYFSFKTIHARNIILIVFSLIFYSASQPTFLIILLMSIAVNFAIAIAIDKADGHWRYVLLGYGVAANLLVLIIFNRHPTPTHVRWVGAGRSGDS